MAPGALHVCDRACPFPVYPVGGEEPFEPEQRVARLYALPRQEVRPVLLVALEVREAPHLAVLAAKRKRLKWQPVK